MATTVAEIKVNQILLEANKEKLKGRFYVYERYKSQLLEVCESSEQLERACIDLAKALRV